MRVVGSVGLLGLVVVAGACATGGAGRSRFESTSISRPSIAQQLSEARDSAYAQKIADAEGPGASVSAQMMSFAGGARRMRATFHLDADAYVIVGHIDASGVMRVVFPLNPDDDGLVKGDKNYQTQEFFAGFTDQYQYRIRSGMFYPTASRVDSYDGGTGYVFIIASWRPMHFDRFQTGGSWDSFEIADEQYMTDPRPAIYELGSLLVGDNREAYTVKFARYLSTQNFAPYGGYGNSAFGAGYCSGFGSMFSGLTSSPFNDLAGPYSFYVNSRSSFYYRGQYYSYDRAFDCYNVGRPASYYAPRQQVANVPVGVPGVGVPKRGFDPENLRRNPIEPRRTPSHFLPGGRVVGDAKVELPRTSPQYRQRGLLTSEDKPGREPRVFAHNVDPRTGPGVGRTRPSIQDMVNRPQPAPATTQTAWRASPGDYGRTSSGSSSGVGTYSPSASRGSSSSSGGSTTSSSAGAGGGGGGSAAAPPTASGSAAGGRPGTP